MQTNTITVKMDPKTAPPNAAPMTDPDDGATIYLIRVLYLKVLRSISIATRIKKKIHTINMTEKAYI